MTDDQLANTQRKISELAMLAMEIDGLDAFIERIDRAPAEIRDLAIAVAAFQQVVVRQMEA